jgi:multiple sugar transport system substrate-binding protein
MTWSRRLLAVVVGACVLAGLAGGSARAGSQPYAGQTITVFVPYRIPQDVITRFTKATGIKVNYNVIGWDATKSKLIVANAAHSYIADVAEFDWSFTGQFTAAKWVEPLNSYLPKSLLTQLKPADAPFTTGGKTYAACYSNDFRLSLYNTQAFKQAGLKSFPKTFAQLNAAAAKLKSAGAAQYPFSIPMAATEGGVTPWYLLTLAMGGHLFDAHNLPLFGKPGSAGYRALQWEVNAVKNGWVSPGAVTLDDSVTGDQFRAGVGAISLASSPGTLATAEDPKQSKIAGHVGAALVPGNRGPGGSFGLPEGLSIPVTAKHKQAAALFIQWWEKPQNAAEIYKQEGQLPCLPSLINQLAAKHQLDGGPVLGQELKQLEPLFPGGAPIWYSEFSSDAQGLLNAAVKGQMSVGDALKQLADKTTALAKEHH